MKSFTPANSRFARRSGFTIVELLVALGITALLVTLMLTIVTNVLSGWNRSSGSLSSGNQARTILDQLSQDLQALVIRQDGNVWLAATVLPDAYTTSGSVWTGAGIVKPTSATSSRLVGTNIAGNQVQSASAPWNDINTYRFGQSGVWLRFFTVVPDTNSATDLTKTSAPRAVSYQIIRKKIGSSTTYSYQMYRSEARPGGGTESTFSAGYNLFMAAGAPSYNTGSSTLGNVGNILTPKIPDQLLANNVIDFGVRVWIADPAANPPKFPNALTNSGFAASTADGITVTPAKVSPLGEAPLANMTYGTPTVIEVMVRILTDEGARQIASLEAGTTTGDWWAIAIANSNVYSRVIQIKSTPL